MSTPPPKPIAKVTVKQAATAADIFSKGMSLLLAIPAMLLLSLRLMTDTSSASPPVRQLVLPFDPVALDCPPCAVCSEGVLTNEPPVPCPTPTTFIIEKLSSDASNELKQVFFSGDSWIIICSEYTQAGLDSKLIAAASFLSVSFPDADLHLGTINCSTYLPSGRSILQRFKLDPHAPVVFAVAHGNKPVQAPRRNLEDALQISWWMRQKTKPRLWPVRNSSTLATRCLSRKTCVVFLHKSPPLLEDQASLILQLQDSPQFRRLHFVSVNCSLFSLELSEPLEGSYSNPAVFFFKQLNGTVTDSTETKWGVKMHEGPFTNESLTQFLSQVMTGSVRVAPLTHVPLLQPIPKSTAPLLKKKLTPGV
jgi:hypothetical protein